MLLHLLCTLTDAYVCMFVCVILHSLCDTGDDFTEAGFDCVMEYVYTSTVAEVLHGTIDPNKLQYTVQAARFSGISSLVTKALAYAVTQEVSTAHLEQ